LDSLYNCLDNTIAQSGHFVAIREARIHKLRTKVKNVSEKEQYQIYFALYLEYQSFRNDSAIYYLSRCISIAEKMDRKFASNDCRALMAFQCSTSGMYMESYDILSHIDTLQLDKRGRCDYYSAYYHLYRELAFYTMVEKLKTYYLEKADLYKKMLYGHLDKTYRYYYMLEQMAFLNGGNQREALRISDAWMSQVKKNSHEYGIAAFYRSLIYNSEHANQRDLQMYWLAESAVNDVRNAVMDQGSLWSLAGMLNDDGQLQRSYSFIRFSWECANHFSTRVRSWQISPLLSTIDKNYQDQSVRTNRQLLFLVVGISVISLLFLVLLFYVNRQRKRLAFTQCELRSANSKLSALNSRLLQVNDDLDCTNSQLSVTNGQLSVTVSKLNESNRVKEEYIGRFMRLCSSYIDKMDNYRKKVNKQARNREFNEIIRLSASAEMKEKELDELYENFDSAFLHLFPNFVNDFNQLLRSEERIVLTERGHLNTDIRIFALIRLGIEDSSKIAEFLHYSVNTIYNYRAKIKNGAVGDRENFEKRVKDIGMSE
jgi:hypothetical protein